MHHEIDNTLTARLATLDVDALRTAFAAQDEFIAIENLLPGDLVASMLAKLPALDAAVHRNYIPKHKKGGSVSRFDLDLIAPIFGALYASTSLQQFLQRLTGQPLQPCPAGDPHTYALYYYTEPGDHIGFHYDTSYYRGARYTVLLGLVSAPSCRLEYELHSKNPARATESGSVELHPGMLVVFNGDKLNHRITPLAAGERRIALTLEYLTNAEMHPFLRFVSNMKDAIAYFGFKQVFQKSRRGSAE